MRILSSIIFSIVSFVVISQNINDLKKQKTNANASKALLKQQVINNEKYYDSIFANIEFEKKNLESVKAQLTKSGDSLNKLIAPFGINESNLGVYQLLIKEKIIDPNSKKYSTYSKKLRKEFAFSEDQKFLIIAGFICLEKFDNKGKVSSFEKIKLSLDQNLKQKKLLDKNAISFLTENNLILENLTGVNSRYLILYGQLNGINDQLKTLNSEIKSNSERKENIYREFAQKKNNIEHEIESITKLINEIDLQIMQISEQIAAETAKTLNYSKFKTKKINGIEVYPAPLSVREFRNGDEIKKARTAGEWNQFNELKIPAYHFKDFDDNQANYGFIYNYYAIIDDRELAPYGFHKLNLIDFNHLENQLLFTNTELVDCYCGDGTEGIYQSCSNCNYWTLEQKKYNVCSKCQNRRYFNKGTKRCSRCKGTKKVKAFSMKDRTFYIMSGTNNILKFERKGSTSFISMNVSGEGKCLLKMRNKYGWEGYEDINELSCQILICKDDINSYSNDFNCTRVGDIEIMNTYLNVTKFRNGDPIKYIEDPVEWELALKNKIPAYCFFNNINYGKGCIYNIHAWNDKRGLMPLGWRSITENDLTHLYLSLGYEFTLTSAQSPIKPPKGVINKYGVFETIDTEKNYDDMNRDYFNHLNFSIKEERFLDWVKYELRTKNKWSRNVESGYILCVRDFTKSNSQDNKTISDTFSIKEFESKSQILNKNYEQSSFAEIETFADYNTIYNNYGVEIIKNLVLNKFDQLFTKEVELKFLVMGINPNCVENNYKYAGNDGDYIYGLKITKNASNDLICSALKVSTSEYRDYYNGNVQRFDNIKLNQINEFSFSVEPLYSRSLNFRFDPKICSPSDNPTQNFHITLGKSSSNLIGFEGDWSDKLSVFYGHGHNRKVIWAIEQVMEFLNEN